jgi:hypothetical protein
MKNIDEPKNSSMNGRAKNFDHRPVGLAKVAVNGTRGNSAPVGNVGGSIEVTINRPSNFMTVF